MGLGVPTFDVPAVDLTVELKSNHLLRDLRRKKHRPEGMLTFQLFDEALASTDFETNPTSCTFDSKSGIIQDSTSVKVVCW